MQKAPKHAFDAMLNENFALACRFSFPGEFCVFEGEKGYGTNQPPYNSPGIFIKSWSMTT